jgi:hypothetical protein
MEPWEHFIVSSQEGPDSPPFFQIADVGHSARSAVYELLTDLESGKEAWGLYWMNFDNSGTTVWVTLCGSMMTFSKTINEPSFSSMKWSVET